MRYKLEISWTSKLIKVLRLRRRTMLTPDAV